MSDVATREEVLQRMSKMLRDGKDSMSDDTFLKVLTAYARLQGWMK